MASTRPITTSARHWESVRSDAEASASAIVVMPMAPNSNNSSESRTSAGIASGVACAVMPGLYRRPETGRTGADQDATVAIEQHLAPRVAVGRKHVHCVMDV